MKRIILALMLLSAAACNLSEERHQTEKRRPDRNARAMEGSIVRRLSPGDSAFYVLGVEYPSGYDWQSDTGGVAGSLVVFENQKRLFSVKLKEGMSDDPDRNHLLGGILYSDYCIDGQTVILKDGKELFRYQGTEEIRGMLAGGGDLYTLGQNRSGKGFSLRLNGTVMFSESEGTLIGDMEDPLCASGALYYDGKSLCFSYSCGEKDKRWYIFRDGEPEELETLPGVREVMDIRSVGNEVFYLCTIGNVTNRLYLVCGNRKISVNDSRATGIRNCRIMDCGEKPCFRCRFVYKDGGRMEVLCDANGKKIGSGKDVYEFYPEGSAAAWINMDGDGTVASVVTDKKQTEVEDSPKLFSRRCATFRDGVFYAVMTPRSGGISPFLWRDGKRLAYNMNGYLLSICVTPE